MACQAQQQRCQNDAAGVVRRYAHNYLGLCLTPAALLQVPSCMPRLHASNPNLSTTLCIDKNEGESLPSAPDATKLQENFCRVASNCELRLTEPDSLSLVT